MTRPTVDMMEALRLTRQGKLAEAMAVLQGASPAAEAAPSRATSKATVIDMMPPSEQSGSAWTVVPTAAESASSPRRDTGQPPASMRNVVFDRLRHPHMAAERRGADDCGMTSPTLPAGATFREPRLCQ